MTDRHGERSAVDNVVLDQQLDKDNGGTITEVDDGDNDDKINDGCGVFLI